MFEAYMADYLAHLAAKGLAPGTLAARECYLRQLSVFLEKRDILDPRAATDRDLLDYQLHLKSEHCTKHDGLLAASTQASHLTALRDFFAWLERTERILVNPMAEAFLPKKPQPLHLPEILTEEEAMKILESCPINTPVGLRDRAILELLYSTGIRRAELVRLNVGDFAADREELAIREGKGKKDRLVPVGEFACRFTEGYLKLIRPWLVAEPAEEALFLNSFTGARLAVQTVNQLVKRAAKRAGVKKRVTPHTFRHSMATHLLRNKADLRHIQAILGHASLETTEIYTHLVVEDLKKAVRNAHPRGRRE